MKVFMGYRIDPQVTSMPITAAYQKICVFASCIPSNYSDQPRIWT